MHLFEVKEYNLMLRGADETTEILSKKAITLFMNTTFLLEVRKIPSKVWALFRCSICWRIVQGCFELQQDTLSFLQRIGFDNYRGVNYLLCHAFLCQE